MSIRPRASFAAAVLALVGWTGIMLLCGIRGASHAFGLIEQYSASDICFWAILIFHFAVLIIEFVRMMNNHYEISEDGLYVVHKKSRTFYPRQQIMIVCQKWMYYKLLYFVVKAQSGGTQILKITYSGRRIKALSDLGYLIAKEF